MDSLRKSAPLPTLPPSEQPAAYSAYLPSFPDTQAYPPQEQPVLENVHPKQKPKRRKLWPLFFLILLIIFFGAFCFLFYKSFSIGRSIQFNNNPPGSVFSDMKRLASAFIKTDHSPLRGEKEGRVNILLLGRAGEHYPGKNLTDTVIVMSIDTSAKKVSLLSLPRDLYAPIPDTSFSTKINSLYQYGLSNNQGVTPLQSAIETITGQKIHYFFILDFNGFEKVVDALHGIEIDVARDFYDPLYPGKNYSYETFSIEKGWQTLDGATALKYVRERHNDPEGDFGRAKRQQQVLQAIKEKAFSLGTFLNIFTLNNILSALGNSVETDMPISDMEKFLSFIKTLDTKNVTSIVVDAWKKESLLRVSHIQVGPTAAFILVPRIGNWSEIHDVSENIFHLDEIKARQSNIKEEKSSLTILASSQDAPVAQKMKQYAMEEMGIATASIIITDTLKNQPKESMIQDRVGLEKPYSLDELMRKFSLKKGSVPSLPQASTADFVITIGSDLAEALSFAEENISTIPDDSAFPEVLPPQPRKK